MSAMKSATILALCIIIGVDGKGLLRGKRNQLQAISAAGRADITNHALHVGLMTAGLELTLSVENVVPGFCKAMTAPMLNATNPTSLVWNNANTDIEIEENESDPEIEGNGVTVLKSITVKAVSHMIKPMFVKLNCMAIQGPQVLWRLLRVSGAKSLTIGDKSQMVWWQVKNLFGLLRCSEESLQLANGSWTIAEEGSVKTPVKDKTELGVIGHDIDPTDIILKCEFEKCPKECYTNETFNQKTVLTGAAYESSRVPLGYDYYRHVQCRDHFGCGDNVNKVVHEEIHRFL